jgi:hypothetical protein
LHNVKLLSTCFGASVATDTSVDFGIKLHHNGFVDGNLVDVINLLNKGEEGKSCDVHIVFNLGLTSEAGFELFVTLDAIDGSASTAETVSAAATSNELITRIFHRVHDSQVARYGIFLTEQKNVNHIFH